MRNRLHKSMMLISIIIIPILLSCASAQQAPDETRLRLRFQDFHTAMWSGDAKAFFEMTTPRFRSEKRLEDIKKDMEEDKKSPRPARRAGLEKICHCRFVSDKMGKFFRCVLLVSITEDKPGGIQVQGLEIWEYIDREWYFMGGGEGEGCPQY